MVEVKNECRRSFRFAQPALKILFRSAASLKISRMYQVRSTLNQCFFEPSGGPSLFIR
ncbi:hypothetical protein FHW11_002819 [Pantoea agglomerans]|uniref:Uncharacterized protein n=1 Tax=Enterobacter agglomerans TaxID=549 RepID=A0ABD6XT39_ENTAG|nr:hypothetical protein BW31_02703 [Pantoea agglomerans]MDF9912429.1 hypothetical protein [Pantoea brenneri]KEY40528.1 hypothetical protein FB99_39950 [Pantoea agglomerans]KPA04873.1 hypothetical protein PAP10c_p3507 [Pantoea agglomerans]MBA8865662.1 hypothetical protein [Pantoea agglomerans]